MENQEIWTKLETIAKSILNVQSTNTELNDILLIMSDDPDRMTYLKNEYGEKEVEGIIKAATNVLYPNGHFNKFMSDFLWNKRDEIIKFTSFQKKPRARTTEWSHINRVVTLLFESAEANIPHFSRFSKNILHIKYTLLVLMSTYPEIVRKDSISDKIGSSKLEIGISQCKHMLERVMKRSDSDESKSFLAERNVCISKFGRTSLREVITNYDDVYDSVELVLKKCLIKCDMELQRLTILLITEPNVLKSNYLKYTIETGIESEAIINEIQKCVNKCIYCFDVMEDVKKPIIWPKEESIDEGNMLSIPIMVSIASTNSKQKLKTSLNKKLALRPHLSILEMEFDKNKKIKNVVCNETTFDWLKTETMALKMHISNPKDLRSVLPMHELRTILMYSSVRLNKPFGTYMEMLKKNNPQLKTELWKPLRKMSHDWKMRVEVDVDSLIELELNKRTIVVSEVRFSFHIKYFSSI